jgi:sphingolipid delta-4 desaturase
MGQHVSKTDFEWKDDDQPHTSRRTEILKKYPEIKQLFGYDPNLKWIFMALVLVQIASLYFLQDKSWPVLIIAAYCFGGIINHSLGIALHDITHNTCFGNAR